MQKIDLGRTQSLSNSKHVKYCKDCGLMKLKGEAGPCVRCSGLGLTEEAPMGKTLPLYSWIPTPVFQLCRKTGVLND